MPTRATALKLTESFTSAASRIAWLSSLIGLVPTAIYSAYRSGGWVAVAICKPVVERLYQKTLDDTLEEGDRDDLQSLRFKVLWWTSYLYHG